MDVADASCMEGSSESTRVQPFDFMGRLSDKSATNPDANQPAAMEANINNQSASSTEAGEDSNSGEVKQSGNNMTAGLSFQGLPVETQISRNQSNDQNLTHPVGHGQIHAQQQSQQQQALLQPHQCQIHGQQVQQQCHVPQQPFRTQHHQCQLAQLPQPCQQCPCQHHQVHYLPIRTAVHGSGHFLQDLNCPPEPNPQETPTFNFLPPRMGPMQGMASPADVAGLITSLASTMSRVGPQGMYPMAPFLLCGSGVGYNPGLGQTTEQLWATFLQQQQQQQMMMNSAPFGYQKPPEHLDSCRQVLNPASSQSQGVGTSGPQPPSPRPRNNGISLDLNEPNVEEASRDMAAEEEGSETVVVAGGSGPGSGGEVMVGEEGGEYEVVEMNAVEILAENTHFCEICGKGFKRDANLRMHMRGHGDEFKTLEALTKPAKGPEDSPTKPRRYSCPFLGCKRNRCHDKFAPLKTILCVKNHYRRSHCPKLLACKKCKSKRFSVLADLRTHEKHCGLGKWRCNCGTNFSRKDKLLGHLFLFKGHLQAMNDPNDEDCTNSGDQSNRVGARETLRTVLSLEARKDVASESVHVDEDDDPKTRLSLVLGAEENGKSNVVRIFSNNFAWK